MSWRLIESPADFDAWIGERLKGLPFDVDRPAEYPCLADLAIEIVWGLWGGVAGDSYPQPRLRCVSVDDARKLLIAVGDAERCSECRRLLREIDEFAIEIDALEATIATAVSVLRHRR